MADGKVIIDSEVNDKGVEKGLKGVQKRLKSTGKRLNEIGTNMTKYVTAPIVGVGAAAFKAADDIDKAMNTIRVGTGATGQDLEQLEEDFKAVFKDVPASADEVSSAIANLNTMTGASGKTLQDLTYSVLEASRTLGEDGVANSQAFGQAMQQWQVPAEQGPALMDSLYKATQDYGIGLGELINQLNTYGPVMQNAGFSTVETADFFGRLNKAGISVSRIMPGLNKAFRDWAAEGKDLQTELDNTIERIRNAETETEALSIATEVFGAEGAQRMTTAIRSGAVPALNELGSSIADQTGLVSKSAEENMTFGEKMKKVWNELTLALEPFGDVMLKLADDVLPVLTDWIGKLADWFQNLSPHMTRMIVLFGGIAAAIGPLLVVLSSVINVFMTIIPVVTTVWNWFSKLSKIFTVVRTVIAALTGPVGIVIAIITALISVGVALYKNWDTVRAVTMSVWNAISNFFSTVLANIRNMFTSAVQTVSNLINTAWNGIRNVTSSVWNGIKNLLSSIWNGIKNIVSTVVNTIKNGISSGWNIVKSITSSVFNSVRNVISSIWNGIKSFISNVLGNIVSGVRSSFNNVVNAVKSRISNVKNSIKNGFNTALNTVKNIGRRFYQAGRNIVTSIADGIRSAISAVTSAISDVASRVRDFLPFSPAKEGPLQDIDDLNFSGPISKSILDGIPEIQKALKKALDLGDVLEGVAPAYAGTGRMVSGGDRTYNRTVNISYGDPQFRNEQDLVSWSRRMRRLRDRSMRAKGVQT